MLIWANQTPTGLTGDLRADVAVIKNASAKEGKCRAVSQMGKYVKANAGDDARITTAGVERYIASIARQQSGTINNPSTIDRSLSFLKKAVLGPLAGIVEAERGALDNHHAFMRGLRFVRGKAIIQGKQPQDPKKEASDEKRFTVKDLEAVQRARDEGALGDHQQVVADAFIALFFTMPRPQEFLACSTTTWTRRQVTGCEAMTLAVVRQKTLVTRGRTPETDPVVQFITRGPTGIAIRHKEAWDRLAATTRGVPFGEYLRGRNHPGTAKAVADDIQRIIWRGGGIARGSTLRHMRRAAHELHGMHADDINMQMGLALGSRVAGVHYAYSGLAARDVALRRQAAAIRGQVEDQEHRAGSSPHGGRGARAGERR